MLSFEDARRCVEEHAVRLKDTCSQYEEVALLASAGRILAVDISADRDYPPFPRATRDGYAVRAVDLSQFPARLRQTAQIKAGADEPDDFRISTGECAEIMTGAPVPAGADAVVMVEHTSQEGECITFMRQAMPGENIVPAGSEAHSGQQVLTQWTRIGYPQIAVAAAVGKEHVRVYQRPRVAILSTGDEIVEISATPGPSQIRNSNSYSLAAQIAAAGGEPVQLPIAPDEPARLRELVSQGLSCDLLLLSGGVSMGKFDLVEEVLREFGAEFFFTGVLIQPGKPVVFGQVTRPKPTYFVGLPGNPISTMVTFELFGHPLIAGLSGVVPPPLRFTPARLLADIITKTGLTRFLPARLSGGQHSPEVALVAWQGSGDIFAVSRANCFLVVPPNKEHITAGEMVSVWERL